MLLDTACAEQTHAGDGFQRPLVPRVRFQPHLMRGVLAPREAWRL